MMPLIAILGGLVMAITLAGGAYYEGYTHTKDHYEAQILTMQKDAQERVEKVRQAWAQQADLAVEALQQTKAKTNVIYRTIATKLPTVVAAPIYRNACFDDDGLRLLNAAIDGLPVEAPNPSGTPTALPATPTPNGG